MRRFRLAVLGGTFDHLHIGHQALLSTAFRVGTQVAVGLTTDRFVREHPKPDSARIQPHRARKAALARWLRANFPQSRWRIVPLANPFGRSVDPEVDVLVISPDTIAGGRAVNRERRRLGRRPVPLEVVPLALGDDLEPVSSRRIRAGIIGRDGRRLAPIRVEVQSADERDWAAAQRAVGRIFPSAAFRERRTTPGKVSRRADLVLEVRKRRAGGWSVVERAGRRRLGPFVVPGSRRGDLESGVRAVLRPREQRNLFGPHRASPR